MGKTRQGSTVEKFRARIPKWGRGISAVITGHSCSLLGEEQRGVGGSVPLAPLSCYMIMFYMNIVWFIHVEIIMLLSSQIDST